MTNDTAQTKTAEPGVWVEGPDGELIPDYESTFPTINEGEVVHGKVVRVDVHEHLVLVDAHDQRGRGRPRQGRARRQGRGARGQRLQVRRGRSGRRAFASAL